jgi:hypothetical protein
MVGSALHLLLEGKCFCSVGLTAVWPPCCLFQVTPHEAAASFKKHSRGIAHTEAKTTETSRVGFYSLGVRDTLVISNSLTG